MKKTMFNFFSKEMISGSAHLWVHCECPSMGDKEVTTPILIQVLIHSTHNRFIVLFLGCCGRQSSRVSFNFTVS